MTPPARTEIDAQSVLDAAKVVVDACEEAGMERSNSFTGCALAALWFYRGTKTMEEDLDLVEEFSSWLSAQEVTGEMN